MTLTPIRGSDYASKAEAIRAFREGANFLVQPDDQLINRAKVEAAGVKAVTIRYANLTRLVIIDQAEDGSWGMP